MIITYALKAAFDCCTVSYPVIIELVRIIDKKLEIIPKITVFFPGERTPAVSGNPRIQSILELGELAVL